MFTLVIRSQIGTNKNAMNLLDKFKLYECHKHWTVSLSWDYVDMHGTIPTGKKTAGLRVLSRKQPDCILSIDNCLLIKMIILRAMFINFCKF